VTAVLKYDLLQTTLDAIELSLSNFTTLKRLDYCFSPTGSSGMEVQHTAKAWIHACPTLKKIDLCQFL